MCIDFFAVELSLLANSILNLVLKTGQRPVQTALFTALSLD